MVVCLCVCMYVCMYVCMCVCVYLCVWRAGIDQFLCLQFRTLLFDERFLRRYRVFLRAQLGLVIAARDG